MVFALLLLGCTPDVTHLYAAERTTALAVASEAPAGWKPDAALGIASPDLAKALRAVVRRAVSEGKPIQLPLALGITATLKPDLDLKKINIEATSDCAACFAIQLALEGQARWEAGPASGSVPISASASAIIAVSVRDGAIIEARPRRVDSLRVEVPTLGNLRVNASGPLQDWLRGLLVDRLAPVRIATLDTTALPIRDLRLSTTNDQLVVELLTDVPGAVPLRALPAPAQGVEMVMSEAVITGLARRAAFQAGTLQMDVAVDPRKLSVDGASFVLDLRLWRLLGRGWYRDYRVNGDLDVEVRANGAPRLRLNAKTADETAASPGALLVDPLAALFQAKILDAIVNAMDRSLPGQTQQRVAGVSLAAKMTAARGLDEALHVYGTLDVAASNP
jgi:hypothetical protein